MTRLSRVSGMIFPPLWQSAAKFHRKYSINTLRVIDSLQGGFHNKGMLRILTAILLLSGSVIPFSAVNAATDDVSASMVDLTADRLVYEKQIDIVTASGNVEIIQDGRTLRADRVVYNVRDDFAYAEGHVSLTDPSGDVHHAERLELNDAMRQGLVQKLYSELNDGSRLWAKTAVRETPEKHILKDARYTPCKACEIDPDKTPTWALRASKVTHDKASAMVFYDDARFEAWGTPIMYIPYFSHPDGSIAQKSGFLAPEIGFGSDYGFNVMVPYYYVIDPSFDVTTGLRFFTRETPQLNLEMRKRFNDAYLTVQTSVANSARTETVNGVVVDKDEELRSHLFVNGLWNFDRKWRAGADIALASDKAYLDDYDIDDEDVLENRLYAERFDDRDYASVELLAFQDLRMDVNVDQPHAMPLAQMSFMGAPNALLGGRWSWDSSYLSLLREGNEQDMNRLSSTVGWQKRSVLPFGLTSRLDLSVRGDAYHTADRDIAKTDPTQDDSKIDSRIIPTAHMEIAYPLQKRLNTSQIRVKPMVGVLARPDVDNDSDIPNEDSIDAQIDAANLFEPDRFPGLDRVEDRVHINYGTHIGYYTDDGDEFSGFFGQSYRFDNDDNPFQNGSGLENQESDIVGQVNASFDNHKHNLNYRFQINGQSMNAERHEVYAATDVYDTRLSVNYLFEKGSRGTEFAESREQIRASATHKIDENWSALASTLYDLGEDSGLRESQLGIGYDDDCFGITIVAERNLQRDKVRANDTRIFARFRLKNLGEFETTAYSQSSDSEDGEQ